MKKFLLAALVIMLFSFITRRQASTTINGIIVPADAATKVLAISGRDSAFATPVSGKFSVTVKAGTWSLLIEAVKPYQNAAITNIVVLDNQPTDVGIITLRE